MESRICVSLLMFLVIFPCILKGEVVHITVLTIRYTNVDIVSWNKRPEYQCYRSNPDGDAQLSFDRSAPITTGLQPPTEQVHSANGDIILVRFPNTNHWRSNGFGPFYCEATKAGHDVTRVTTFFQRSDAKFRSSDGTFTKTVSVNDSGVTISMMSRGDADSPNKVITWRKDGGDVITSLNGHIEITSNSVQTSAAGIYEVYYNNERSQNRGGLYRLIVRECPAGKWGPPDCYGVCDKCYNGGVCDDKSGLCICPNNFKGPNCLSICRNRGGNRFGLNCEFRCTYRSEDPAFACRDYLFCLPDPYGCSCDAGYQGYACNTDCSAGSYGAGCTQTCHCASGSCDAYSGICSESCTSGWSGVNCQIPDQCETGYYGENCVAKCHCLNDGPCSKQRGECSQQKCAAGYSVRTGQMYCQECPDDTFGEGCEGQCHCATDACDKVTGRCDGECIDTWIAPDCQTRISRTDFVKVNPYQPSTMTCYVEGNSPASVNLVRIVGNTGNTTGITKRSSSLLGSELAVVFEVDSVYPQDYTCVVVTMTSRSASLPITNPTYVLPVINTTPVILGTTTSTVRLAWDAWVEGVDEGDPPLVGYDVFVRISGNWIMDQRVLQPVTSATVDGLSPDTDYRFRVAAVREGPGGTGQRSERNEATTLCIQPSASPNILQILADNPKELHLTWQPISSEAVECRSGVTSYTIYYTPSGSSIPNSVMAPSNTTSYTLRGLQTYLYYTIQITASNKDGESERSSGTVQRTPEEDPPAPINVSIPSSTTSSFTVAWSTPSPSNINGNIQRFMIRYQETISDNNLMEIVAAIEGVPINAFQGVYTVMNLQPETNYTVQVQTVNGAGSGNWSEKVNAKTVLSGPVPNAGPSVGSVVGGVFGALIIVILVCVLVVGFLRRRRNDKNAGSQIMQKQDGNGTSAVIYENTEIDFHVNTHRGAATDNPAYNESEYDCVGSHPAPPPSKPAIAPRAQSKDVMVKPVGVVLPNNPKPSSERKPVWDEIKPKGDAGKRRGAPVAAPRDQSGGRESPAPRVGARDQSGTGASLQNGTPTQGGGEIYENVVVPGPVLVSELETYIKKKGHGNVSELIHEFNLLNVNQLHPWTVASKEKNKAKNRFKNIIAYDHSRVVLDKVDGDPHSDYYNANFLNDYKGKKKFIASQAPNTASLTAFWRMIWAEDVTTIVMVTNLIEAGKDRCRQYWPQKPRSVETIGQFSLFLLQVEEFSDHIIRTLIVKKEGDELDEAGNEVKRTIKQFHYLSWPDMGVPEYHTTLISFTESVKQHYTALPSPGPMLVHCSAGVGRTGTFICLYNMLDMMREEGRVDIFGFITKMRDRRIKMVQTKEQYVFLYKALLEVYLSGNTEIPVSEFRKKFDSLRRVNYDSKKTNIELEFEVLGKLTPLPPARSFQGGRASRNRKKNRFHDVLPMERNRPYLMCDGFADSSDYINASFLNTFLKKDVFLATQAPLANTVGDLWRMVFDWKCPVIVMLNELDEDTCVQYWPEEGSMSLGSLEVTTIDTHNTSDFVKRKFEVASTNGESVPVEHFEMLGWGRSHNKPDSPLSLLEFIDTVQSSAEGATTTGPVIVHCINGVGRTGVFCALWSVMEKVKRENRINIFEAVKRLRSSRPNMVENEDEYQLCYDVMNQYLQQFEEYANLDVL